MGRDGRPASRGEVNVDRSGGTSGTRGVNDQDAFGKKRDRSASRSRECESIPGTSRVVRSIALESRSHTIKPWSIR